MLFNEAIAKLVVDLKVDAIGFSIDEFWKLNFEPKEEQILAGTVTLRYG
jgi:hypothetical protein